MGVFPEVALPTHPPTGLNFLLAEQMLGHRLKKGSALTNVNFVQHSQELAFIDSEQKVQAIVLLNLVLSISNSEIPIYLFFDDIPLKGRKIMTFFT